MGPALHWACPNDLRAPGTPDTALDAQRPTTPPYENLRASQQTIQTSLWGPPRTRGLRLRVRVGGVGARVRGSVDALVCRGGGGGGAGARLSLGPARAPGGVARLSRPPPPPPPGSAGDVFWF